MKTYTLIGSRNIPAEHRDILHMIAKFMRRKGYTVRSGGASGSDTIAEDANRVDGVLSQATIFLPYDGFMGKYSLQSKCYISRYNKRENDSAEQIAAQIHPVWGRLSKVVKRFHTRNVYQVLGYYLNTPSDFVVYYAPETNGVVSGGTATAVNLARAVGVKTYNVGLEHELTEFITFMESL